MGLAILERLEQAGHEAFFVGGCVRDKLWGKPVKDIDIATSALPEQVVELFVRTIPTGLKHGTVTVLMDGLPFEVTTYRRESGYADYRRPAEVEFISDLEEDLRRRDFTMNAMAMDRFGHIRDPFHGRRDMDAGLLRCVGEPEERFEEDALRMLRCIRFASSYGLEIDPKTWQALLLRRELLRHVAMERVRMELERTMGGSAPLRGWQLVLDSGLLGSTKVELEWPYSAMSRSGLPQAACALDELSEPLHRWMLLVLLVGLEAGRVERLFRQLTFSVKDTERILRAVKLHRWVLQYRWRKDMLVDAGELKGCSGAELWKLGVLEFGPEAALDWLALLAAAVRRGFPGGEQLALLLAQGGIWLEEMPVTAVKELAVSGRDLIAASGREAGPWVSRAMLELLRLAATGRLPNTQEALIKEALSQ